MEGYRFQQLVYLVVPVMVGIELFANAKVERDRSGRESAGALALDLLGVVFAGVIPAVFALTIATLDYKMFPLQEATLHRLDRYGVMFLFLGSWWQVFLMTGLRARRLNAGDVPPAAFRVLAPYVIFGSLISALVLWVAPWNLMWVSVFWFVASAGVLAALKVSPGRMATIFLVLAALGFFGENILFIWLDAVV